MKKGTVAFCSALILVSAMYSGCKKQQTTIQDDTTPIDTTFKPIETFSDVDTSDDASFKDASLSDELAKKAQEAFKPVYFDYNSYSLNTEAINQMVLIGEFLRSNLGVRVLISGHCDERGSSDYNMGLGENRARSIRDYLNNYGIELVRLEITSMGKEQPAETGCDDNDGCHSKNRRSEFRVLAR